MREAREGWIAITINKETNRKQVGPKGFMHAQVLLIQP
jgi:hypothetical protein